MVSDETECRCSKHAASVWRPKCWLQQGTMTYETTRQPDAIKADRAPSRVWYIGLRELSRGVVERAKSCIHSLLQTCPKSRSRFRLNWWPCCHSHLQDTVVAFDFYIGYLGAVLVGKNEHRSGEDSRARRRFNPLNASCSKLLLFKRSSAILV